MQVLGIPFGTYIEEQEDTHSPLAHPQSVLDPHLKKRAIELREEIIQRNLAAGATVLSPDTFRARNADESKYPDIINAQFGLLDEFLAQHQDGASIQRVMWAGPCGDCYVYTPEDTIQKIAKFHERQAKAAARHNAMPIFETVNSTNQAVAAALAAKYAGVPQAAISFVLNAQGRLMGDESHIAAAIEAALNAHEGVTFGFNCSRHLSANNGMESLCPTGKQHITIYYPNADQTTDPWVLDSANAPIQGVINREANAQHIATFGERHNLQLKIVSGCCGHGHNDIKAIVHATQQLSQNI